MTEEEAKTKWCPMSRVSLTKGEVGYNRVDGGIPSEYATCIGSDCMAWAWDKTEYEYSGGKVDDSGWEEVAVGCWRKKRENREGFCGFGGSR